MAIPVGSTWRRNPIPGCINGAGVLDQALCGLGRGRWEKDFMFPPPGSDPARSQWHKLLGGYGVYSGVADGGECARPRSTCSSSTLWTSLWSLRCQQEIMFCSGDGIAKCPHKSGFLAPTSRSQMRVWSFEHSSLTVFWSFRRCFVWCHATFLFSVTFPCPHAA